MSTLRLIRKEISFTYLKIGSLKIASNFYHLLHYFQVCWPLRNKMLFISHSVKQLSRIIDFNNRCRCHPQSLQKKKNHDIVKQSSHFWSSNLPNHWVWVSSIRHGEYTEASKRLEKLTLHRFLFTKCFANENGLEHIIEMILYWFWLIEK